MDFSEALKLLKRGKNIRRSSWSGNRYITLFHENRNEYIMPYTSISTKYGKVDYTFTNCDILANDWVLV